jgi:hypothetical protein
MYLLLAWRPERYRACSAAVAQAGVVLVVGYNMLVGETEVGDGLLAFAVSLIFSAVLAFLWITEQRTVARLKAEAEIGGEEHGRLPPDFPPQR